MRFAKYHGLGNDYIVLEALEAGDELRPEVVRRICDRHYGLGADGILLGPIGPGRPFRLRIYNPDGSEAEKSGNGLRIFARYLLDTGRAGPGALDMVTSAGPVRAEVLTGGDVRVEMGTVSFQSGCIPVTGPPREVIDEEMTVLGQRLRTCAATIGNPHCVVLDVPVTAESARRLGPAIETDPRFPHRTNVQFLEVVDRRTLRIEIWERGAGYTLASGSSSVAAAAVAVRLGLCERQVTVRMPGGQLQVTIGPDFAATLLGPVTKIADGTIDPQGLAWRAV